MNQSPAQQPKPKFTKWLWTSLVVLIIAAGVSALTSYWYYSMGPGKNSLSSKKAVSLSSSPLIGISFKNEIDRQQAENILNQYGEKVDDETLYKRIYDDSTKTSWNIYQGRFYQISLELRSGRYGNDLDLLKSSNLFQTVSSTTRLISREDVAYDNIKSFLDLNGFIVTNLSTSPIHADFQAPRSKKQYWLEIINKNPDIYGAELIYPV